MRTVWDNRGGRLRRMIKKDVSSARPGITLWKNSILVVFPLLPGTGTGSESIRFMTDLCFC